MTDTIIIDTDILIDVARGCERATAFLEEMKSQRTAAVSSVTEMELIIGCENKRELKHLETFLSDFTGIDKFGISAITPKEFLELIGGL